MNRLFFLLLLLTTGVVGAQKPKWEDVEMRGEVLAVVPGVHFAYSSLILKTGLDTNYFRFPPESGDKIVRQLKPGTMIDVRAKVSVVDLNIRRKMRLYYFMDELLAVKWASDWISLEGSTTYRVGSKLESRLFLEKKVTDDYIYDNRRVGLLFDHGLVAYNSFNSKTYYPMKEVRVGDKVSFMGYRLPGKEGYVYPKPDVKEVFSFGKLAKAEGTVKSYLVKQNYVYIGLVLQTSGREIPTAFPSDLAKEIKQFADRHPDVLAYYNDFPFESKTDPPELHALVSGTDTLKIERFGFGGGADVAHEHKPADVAGKISSVNKSDKGKIMSVIIGNDYYIEVDHIVEKNLGNYLKKGTFMKISGDERIKNEGEIYSRNYRIITPRKITVDEKEFQVNSLSQ